MQVHHALARLSALCLGTSVALAGLAVVAPADAAPTCSNTGCDNLGPQGNGCFEDDVLAAKSGAIRLRYSAACQAFWAYAPVDPDTGSVELSLEMQHKEDGAWVTVRRLFATQEADPSGDVPDWTNALGARGKLYRFRAIRNAPAPAADDFTAWVVGGAQG
jgi:hypothetical protein